MKGWFTITSESNMSYTQDMERAMSQSHNISLSEYENEFSNQLKVERRREQEYQACKHIVAKFDSQLPK